MKERLPLRCSFVVMPEHMSDMWYVVKEKRSAAMTRQNMRARVFSTSRRPAVFGSTFPKCFTCVGSNIPETRTTASEAQVEQRNMTKGP